MTSTTPDDLDILQLFIGITESSSIRFPITLQVGGIHVSGMLTTTQDYAKGIRDWTKQNATYQPPTGLSEAEIRRIIEDVFDVVAVNTETATVERNRTDNEEPVREFEFIHLRDAKFFEPGLHAANQGAGVWWRGRVSAIDGFFFGALA